MFRGQGTVRFLPGGDARSQGSVRVRFAHQAVQASDEGRTMADKSPRHAMSKKSGKSLKEKRSERKTKADTTSQMDRLTTTDKKH